MAENISFKQICNAFQIHPAQVYALEARGALHGHPHGTPDFILDLAAWCRESRGPLPPEAEAILRDAQERPQ